MHIIISDKGYGHPDTVIYVDGHDITDKVLNYYVRCSEYNEPTKVTLELSVDSLDLSVETEDVSIE